jgi:hypothetical protein
MTDLDAEAKKLGGDFQKRQARLVEAIHQRTTTASGFEAHRLRATKQLPATPALWRKSREKQSAA